MKLVEGGQPTRATTFVPGVGGYVLALLVGWFVCAVLLLVPNFFETGLVSALSALVIYVQLLMVACATYGLPVSVVTVLVVQLSCRRVRSEAVHVLVAGVVGGLLGGAWVHLTLPPLFDYETANSLGDLWPAVAIGTGAAAGRLLGGRWLPVRRPA